MLNSLEIKNFRMLEDFKVAKLGRVNLIVGKNNSGKSTVLEALRIYAEKATQGILDEIAASHHETRLLNYKDTGKSNIPLPFEDLFANRKFPAEDGKEILIGESEADKKALFIQHVFYISKLIEAPHLGGMQVNTPEIILKSDIENLITPFKQALWIHNYNNEFQFLISFDYSIPPAQISPDFYIPVSFIPTEFISMDKLERDWGEIVGTEHEEIIKQAMRIILPEFENIYFVPNLIGIEGLRIAKVKIAGYPRPVPLKSLGDGMIRVLQLALKLVSAQGGFLLIDEFENGLHYSTQEKIWALLFEMAEKLDIQVFATTHSWDCIESFTKVALEHKDVGGVLFRMGKSVRTRDKGKVIATVFSEDELATMTQIDMEIR